MALDTYAPRKHYQICVGCSAEVDKICTLADLQKLILRKPFTTDANIYNVDVTNIPADCPSGYISMKPQPLTK